MIKQEIIDKLNLGEKVETSQSFMINKEMRRLEGLPFDCLVGDCDEYSNENAEGFLCIICMTRVVSGSSTDFRKYYSRFLVPEELLLKLGVQFIIDQATRDFNKLTGKSKPGYEAINAAIEQIKHTKPPSFPPILLEE